jgi:hypothetical protein
VNAPDLLEVNVESIRRAQAETEADVGSWGFHDTPIVADSVTIGNRAEAMQNHGMVKPQAEVWIDRHGRFLLQRELATPSPIGPTTVSVLVTRRHPRWERLRRELAFIANFNGRLYQKVLHPDLDFLPAHRQCTERIEIVRPHLPRHLKTVIDLGAAEGAFSRFLEDEGFDVLAVEQDPSVHFYLRLIRDTMGYRFRIFPHDIRRFRPSAPIDVLWAMSVLHWFTKTKTNHDSLVDLLRRLSPKVIFFQPTRSDEYTNQGRYRLYEPDEFADLVRQWAGLTTVKKIGVADNGRPIYLID